MLKKIMLLALSLALVLCAASAFAEAAEEAEMHTLQVNKSFEIQSRIPEGYNFMPIVDTELNLVGLLKGGEDQPMVTVSIAYNDEYAEVERFNDVDETTVGLICDSFLELDDVSFEDLETAYGTRLLKVTDSDKSFVDIYTIYKGYELEFVITHDPEVTEADVQMLVDFISDMQFITLD